jgi:hypothetical protein
VTVVRTLTWVAALALLAGLAVGFFVSEARAVATPAAAPRSADPVVERKVEMYATRYDLSREEVREVRTAIEEYDRGLLDLLRQLRARHRDEFKALSDRANARIDAVLSGKRR